MSLDPPFPALDDVMLRIGEAGRRMADIGASEGAAGNISVYIGWPLEFQPVFPLVEEIDLPVAAPALAGGVVLVTGSGRRLREVYDHPTDNLGVVQVPLTERAPDCTLLPRDCSPALPANSTRTLPCTTIRSLPPAQTTVRWCMRNRCT